MTEQADRINFTFGMKLPGPVQYASVQFSSSLSTDVKEGETREKAYKRAKKFVEEKVEEMYDEIQEQWNDGKEEKEEIETD